MLAKIPLLFETTVNIYMRDLSVHRYSTKWSKTLVILGWHVYVIATISLFEHYSCHNIVLALTKPNKKTYQLKFCQIHTNTNVQICHFEDKEKSLPQ